MAEANEIDNSKTLQGIQKNTKAIQENTEGVHPAIMAGGAKTTRGMTDAERHARELESVIALPSERVQVGSFGEKVRAKQEEAIKRTQEQIEGQREVDAIYERRKQEQINAKEDIAFQNRFKYNPEIQDLLDSADLGVLSKNTQMANVLQNSDLSVRDVRVSLNITAAPGLSDIISITQESKVGLTSNKSAVHGSTNFYVT